LTSNKRKLEYEKFLVENSVTSIFQQDWWLDALCGRENWDVCLVKRDGKVVGALPLYFKNKLFFFRLILQPPLTQFLGPIIKNHATKYDKKISNEKKIMNELIKEIPKFSYFNQSWSSDLTNWLPFYWNGFKQTTQYSYSINDLRDLDKVWNNLTGAVRTDIRKAQKKNIKIRFGDIEELYLLYKSTYAIKNKKPPLTKNVFLSLDKACSAKNCGKIFIAEDANGLLLSGAYIVWDHNTAYYLIGGLNDYGKKMSSQSYLLWEAINFSSHVTKKFDFEGSMNEQIESFFRGFGAEQRQYFSVSKTSSKLLNIVIEILY